MSVLSAGLDLLGVGGGAVSVGNDAGWVLAFHSEKDGKISEEGKLVLTRDDYYAEIDATLPGGLEGGSYSFTIEGVTDDHYKQLKGGLSVVRLYLSWRDTAPGVLGAIGDMLGSLADAVGGSGAAEPPTDTMVAELKVTNVSRRLGARRYEAVITAQERAFLRLQYRFPSALEAKTYADAAKAIAEGAKVDIQVEPQTGGLAGIAAAVVSAASGGGAADDAEPFHAMRGSTRLEAVSRLASAMEQKSKKYGRGMALIRNGTLHLGPRDIPTKGAELNFEGGLIQVEPVESADKSGGFDAPDGKDDSHTRKQYKITLKGRPDLKPGAVVAVAVTPEDVGKTAPQSPIPAMLQTVVDVLGGGGNSPGATAMYVNSVRHQLGRTTGFVTTLTAIEVGGNAWDDPATVGDSSGSAAAAAGGSVDPAVHAAHAIRKASSNVIDSLAFPEVGEVRVFNPAGGPTDEPPSQTSTVWQGLVGGDGRGSQARRLDVDHEHPSPVRGVAYATPFALGKCGLVLPRYPGTRVVMLHRDGDPADPIDIGSLWQSGHGPKSEPGDWWLSLPVDWTGDAAALGEKDKPKEHTGKVTQDLTDGAGNRVIEIGALTIRVGKDALKDAGTRPEKGEADAIVIEVGKSSISIKADGTITIRAKKVDFVVDEAVNVS